MERKLLAAAAIAVTAGTLAACGTNPAQRALSGAALGAGAGAVGAALLDGNVGAGALIGGGLGAGAGYLTDPNTLNLGEPAWGY